MGCRIFLNVNVVDFVTLSQIVLNNYHFYNYNKAYW